MTVFSSFEAARSTWQEFERDGDFYAFQAYAWCSNWFDLIGAGMGLMPCITAVQSQRGEPLMLLPLAIEQRRLHTALVWIGGVISDYHAPLLGRAWAGSDAAHDFLAAWERIREALPPHDIVAFEKMPALIGNQQNPFSALRTQPHPAQAHSASLDGSLAAFLRRSRSTRSRQSDRRKERRLAEKGRLEFIVADTPDRIMPLLNAMIEQKVQSYAELGVPNPFETPGCVEFIARMTSQHREMVRLFALTLDGQPLATLWGLVHGDRYYHLFPTYARNRYSAFSPGNILLVRAFGWCIDNGIAVYDFTVGDEAYKRHWCENELPLFDIATAVTARGLPFANMHRARSALKRLVKASPWAFSVAKRVRGMLGRSRRGQSNASVATRR